VNQTAICVEGLGKFYRLGALQPFEIFSYRSLRETVTGAVARVLYGDRRAGIGQPPDGDSVWALRDVNLEIKRGEVLGLIGPNGAGKSTLLKILSRITEPTEGRVLIYGRVGSLLEVGTGFHPELTGRENIYLNGAILGMGRAEISRKFDEIVDFSGVNKFIDTPVKRYSSGMYVRLAFSVAAHLEPEILLVDEVLAVGDVAFQQRCVGRMSEIAASGNTVVFVTHNLAAVRNLCSRAVFLDCGRVQKDGAVDEVIEAYLGKGRNAETPSPIRVADRRDRSGNGRVRVVNFDVRRDGGKDVQTGGEVECLIDYEAEDGEQILRLLVGISVMNMQGANVFLCSTGMYHSDFRDLPCVGQVVCRIPDLPLVPGEYWLSVVLKDDQGLADSVERIARLRVVDGGAAEILGIASAQWGSVIVRHHWEWRPSEILKPGQ